MRQTKPTKEFNSGKHSFLYHEWIKESHYNNFFATHKPYDIKHRSEKRTKKNEVYKKEEKE